MAFSQDFIEKVRDANNIVDVLGEYTTFNRSSRGQHMACCPLPGHNEKTPSFSVSETKQVYHCFGCSKSGNIFDALRELKGLSFPEAVEYLALKAHIAIPPEMRGGKRSDSDRGRRTELFRINQSAARFFHKGLMGLSADHPVRAYVRGRGLTKALVEEFEIGYASDGWEELAKHLQKNQLSTAAALELGLLKKRKSGDGVYDMFRHRMMFPIQNHLGDYVGFGGRSLEKDQMPKYINSSDSEVFHKNKTLYGLYQTARHVREADEIVIVEGYMDFLALYGAGIKNVAATLGTALTEQHARLLKRFTKNIVVLFDGDSAGQEAAKRSLPILLSEGLIPKAVVLAEGLDPDDYIRQKGVEALKEKIVAAPELFIWLLGTLLKTYRGSPGEKLNLLDEVSGSLKCISDSRLRSIYIGEVVSRTGIEPHLVEASGQPGASRSSLPKSQGRNLPEKGGTTVTPESPQNVTEDVGLLSLKKSSKAEIYLLNLALSSEERWRAIWVADLIESMAEGGVREIFLAGQQFLLQNPNSFDKLTAYLMTRVDSRREIGWHMTKAFNDLGDEERDKMQSDCISKIQAGHLRDKMRQITARMRSQTAEDQLKELEQIVNMKRVKRTL